MPRRTNAPGRSPTIPARGRAFIAAATLFGAAVRLAGAVLLGATALLAATAAAQPAAEPSPLVPPALLEFVEAEYPPEAAARGEGATVELLLTIDVTGRVTAAEVTASAGPDFDAAAVDAAKRFVFTPARRGETPIAARIGYRYVFELKPPPPDVTPPPTPTPEPVAPEPATAPEVAPQAPLAEFSARATVDPPPREVTRRTVRREELTRVPGTRGDALRTVELLPGVGRPPFGSGNIIVRGASPRDTGVFLDGSPVPLLYHFGGLTSFTNSRLLERIDFYPGNFSVRYGRLMAGILEVGVRDPAEDKLHGVADVNLLDASLLVEGPITDEWSIAASARRSYIDFFFKEVVPDDFFDVVSAPVYWDYQLFSTWRPTPKDRVRFGFYGSSDALELIFSEPLDGDPAIRGDFDQLTQFHRGQLAWRHSLSPDVDQDLMISFGPTLLDFALGDQLRFDAEFWQYYGRAEWTGRISERASVTGGLDMFWTPFEVTYRGPPPDQQEGNPNQTTPLASRPIETVSVTGRAYRPAFYLEGSFVPVGPLRVVPGVRFDWYREIDSWTVNPRVASVLSFDEATRLKGGVGLFSQPPDFAESSPELGNPGLEPNHALHASLGVERDLADGITVGVEGYFKHLWNLVVGTPAGVDPRFSNDGVGRIYGMELSGRVEPRGRPFFGFLSYTLSRSERRDRLGSDWRFFDFDQTHILSVAGVYRLGRGWEAGAAFRFVSGNPNTPISGSYFDDSSGVYVPLYGGVNSIRSGTFHRLDVRLEKQWTFTGWKLAAYLDVQNVYNRPNQEGLLYNYDFTESAVLPGLPVLPTIGLRGEL